MSGVVFSIGLLPVTPPLLVEFFKKAIIVYPQILGYFVGNPIALRHIRFSNRDEIG